jgi:hypothetical protein
MPQMIDNKSMLYCLNGISNASLKKQLEAVKERTQKTTSPIIDGRRELKLTPKVLK